MSAVWNRRRFTRILLAATAVLAAPLSALARNREAFQSKKTAAAVKSLFGDAPISDSPHIALKMPQIAEDGSIVPVTVTTELEDVKSISLLVDANPNPLSAQFQFMPGAVPQFKTRIKMGDSSDVHAIVETEAGLYRATTNVKVTLGGCGG